LAGGGHRGKPRRLPILAAASAFAGMKFKPRSTRGR
jgi:hypothetical protein